MPGFGTSFIGPVLVGTRPQTAINSPSINDFGNVTMMQRGTVVAAGTTAVSGTIYVPVGAVVTGITEDTLVAWNAGSAVATVGTAAADTSFCTSNTVTSTGRVRPTFSATNLINMGSIATPGQMVYTVTPSASCSAGSTVFTIEYAPTVQQYIGAT